MGLLGAAATASCSGPSHPPVSGGEPGSDASGSSSGGVETPDGDMLADNTVPSTEGGDGEPDETGPLGSDAEAGLSEADTHDGRADATDACVMTCSGACTDTTSDPMNCGACGRNCQGASCSNSLCAPTSIAQPGGSPLIQSIAVDDTNVYWTVGGLTGGVYLKPTAGGNAVLVSSPEADPIGIAIDHINMFWADFSSGGLYDESIYAAGMSVGTRNTLVVPPDGSAPGPTALAVDSSNVYWVDRNEGTVYQLSLHGDAGPPTPLQIASGQSSPVAVAVDATNVYWGNYGSSNDGAIVRVPIGGGSPTTIVAGQTNPWSLALDSTYVYWTSKTNPGPVRAIAKTATGSTAPIDIAPSQPGPWGIAVDAQHVYWTNFNGNTVVKAPLPVAGDAGAASTTLLAGSQNLPTSIAIDTGNVYWVSQGNAQILRVVK